LLDEPGREGTFAAFGLGNTYYAAAADTAAEHGWNHAFTRAHLDSAEVYLDRAIARDSTFVEAYVNLGSLYDDRANIVTPGTNRNEALVRAEDLYQKALAIDAHDEKARCNLGSLYLRQRRTMDAKEQFLTVLEHNPESALAHYNLAIMFAEAKIYREAIREWERAAEDDPDGDIGERSRDNIEIVKQLQESEPPDPASH
jgi:tetratricopeptide (TPR) repeat protein